MSSGSELVTFEAAQELERQKIQDIQLIDDEKKLIMADALQYQVIPYFPINKEFIQKYILNDTEYPSIEGKISQAATEMKSRLGNLINSNYDYINQLMELELAEIELEELIEELEPTTNKFDKGTIKESELKKFQIKLTRKKMDVQFKKFKIAGAKNGAEKLYNEFLNWKLTIEEYVAELQERDPNITGIDDLNWDEIRCAEMEMKVLKWRRKMQQGEELTPSQKVLVDE